RRALRPCERRGGAPREPSGPSSHRTTSTVRCSVDSPPMTSPPLDVDKVLKEFSGEVPLFPLPSLVLFPDTIVPLLVFEDRYRVMVRDALKGERLLGLALMKPGWETGYEGNPSIYERLCVGTILTHELLPDGRYKLLLYGLFRADVVEETQQAPYRKAKVVVS